VRDLEAGRVRTPRVDTVRLLADALQLSGPERERWLAAARGLNHLRTGPAMPAADVPPQLPGDVPARPPGRWGSGMGNSHRCRPRPVRESHAEIVGLRRPDNGAGGPAAQDAGAAQKPVRAWTNKPGPDAEVGSGGGLSCADRRELVELRRENRRLRDDLETLKRATAILANAAW
jgi:transposase